MAVRWVDLMAASMVASMVVQKETLKVASMAACSVVMSAESLAVCWVAEKDGKKVGMTAVG